MKRLMIVLLLAGMAFGAPPKPIPGWATPQPRFSFLRTMFDTRTGGGGGAASISPFTIVDANTIAQSNSTTAQSFFVYGTVDNVASPTNYERAGIRYSGTTSSFEFFSEKGGTGTARDLVFKTTSGKTFKFLDDTNNARFYISSATGNITQYGTQGAAGVGVAAVRGTILASTAQTASLGATNVLTGTAQTAGLYRVCYQASTTTSGTGTTGTVTIAWNDGNAKSFTTGTWALNAVDATGQVNGCQVFRVAASQNITVATTIGSIGTSVYRVDAQAEQLQ